jgi:flagellar biosynthesis protein FliR
MGDSYTKSKLVFGTQRALENTSPDTALKSFWVSTALALILSLPCLAIFLGLLHLTDNIVIGVVTGFTTHFVLLALSPRTSQILSSLFD